MGDPLARVGGKGVCVQGTVAPTPVPVPAQCRRTHACRYIYAAREMGWAATNGMSGDELEADVNWQYISKNGLDSLFRAYSVSLDLYIKFCWTQLGELGNLMVALLVVEVGG